MQLGNQVQAGLLVVYLVLSIIFVREKQYMPALYYVGCLVKDAAVFVLAWWSSR